MRPIHLVQLSRVPFFSGFDKSRNPSEILLLDVTPFLLGLEIVGGVMTISIIRSIRISATKTQTFSTCDNNHPITLIQVFEDKLSMTNDNNSLRKFFLDGIPPIPRS